MNYWLNRLAKQQNEMSDVAIKKIEKQMAKYYSTAAKKVIKEFELTYEKVLKAVGEGEQPTPADLYKLDKYWQMQGQLRNELEKLGNKEIKLLSKEFNLHFFDVYYSFALEGVSAFNTIDTAAANAMINSVWLADGKTFSQRVWGNIENLVETLNDNLINCVVTGKKTTELTRLLQDRFNVSYNKADTLVKTEITHIQTQAAAQRYMDYGLTQYKFLASPDDRTCGECAELDGKVFYYSEMKPGVNAPPMHPRDRCSIVPVVNKK